MGKEFLKYDEVEIEKREFHSSKRAIHTDDVSTDKIKISDEFPFSKNGSKYFVGYNNNEKAIPFKF